MGLTFQGFRYDDDWSLLDANLEVPNDWTDANLFMCGQKGMLFLVRIGKDRYRAISNRPEVQSLLPSSIRVKKVLWESEFHVSCRQVDRYQKGRVFVMGDAAHIHSPAGGRGMNMGIEDACVLAQLLSQGDAERYTEMRHKPGHQTIVLTNRLFRIASLQNPILVGIRNFFIKHVVSRPGFQRKIIVKMSGLEQQWQS